MKIKILITLLFAAGFAIHANAQRVRVQLRFPVGMVVTAPHPAPYRGAIWVGPEWRWYRGRYVAIPGYWARPNRYHHVWARGHWQHARHGYRWIPGHWR